MRSLLSFFVVTLLCLSVNTVSAGESAEKSITIYGKAVNRVLADQVRVTFTIEGFGKDLSTAFENGRNKLQNITDSLMEIGINSDKIVTSRFSNRKNYGGKPFLSSKKDFKTYLIVELILDDFTKLEPSLIALSNSDIVGVDNISFEITDIESARKAALEQAVNIAKEKASLAAKELGVELGNIHSLNEIVAEPIEKTQYNRNFLTNTIMVSAQRDVLDKYIYSDGLIKSDYFSIESEVKLIYLINDSANQ